MLVLGSVSHDRGCRVERLFSVMGCMLAGMNNVVIDTRKINNSVR